MYKKEKQKKERNIKLMLHNMVLRIFPFLLSIISDFMDTKIYNLYKIYLLTEANKENIPSEANQDLQELTAILQAAGLEDGRPLPDIEQPNQGRKDSSSETPLGSLDRTKVSLGESERTTDSKRFLR